jgi:hypothetical protein
MVVDNLDVVSVAVSPREADAPSVVDPDAELPRPRPAQLLEVIAGRYAQVIKHHRSIQLSQPPQGNALNIASVPSDRLEPEEPLRVGIAEAANHLDMITRYVMGAKLDGAVSNAATSRWCRASLPRGTHA